MVDLLKETKMLGCKPIDAPIKLNHKVRRDKDAIVDQERYQRLVGKLIYLSHTRSISICHKCYKLVYAQSKRNTSSSNL